MNFVKTVCINIFILVLLLLVLEVGLRVSQSSRGYFKRNFAEELIKPSNPKDSWMKYDNDLGWVCDHKNLLKTHSPELSDTFYAINKQGFRSDLDFEKPNSRKKKILLIGDSFLFGIFLPEHETIAAKIEGRLENTYQIYNLSSPGWGIDQMYLAYKKYIKSINPDVVIMMYIDNDMLRILHSRRDHGIKPILRIDENQLVVDQRPAGILEKFCWTNQISNRLYAAYMKSYAITLSKKMFEEIIQSEKSTGRRPLFVHIVSENQVLEKSRTFLDPQEFIINENAEYIELLDTLRLLNNSDLENIYLPNDQHFSERGCELVAGLILDKLKKSHGVY